MARKKPLFKTYTAQDDRRLKTLVSDFNKKRNVMQKELGYQPPKIKYSELASQIGSRAEYNRVLSVYGRYLRPGSERIYTNSSGIKFTSWERNENRYAIQRINNRRAKRLSELQIKFSEGQMGRMEDLNLLPAKNWTETYKDTSNFNKYFRSLQHQANVDYWKRGEDRYKENYLTALDAEFYGMKDLKQLKRILKGVSGRQMLEATGWDATLTAHFVYGYEDKQMRLSHILVRWKEVVKQWK